MPFTLPDAIETPRLIVRPVRADDLPALMDVNGDDAVTGFLPYASWQSLHDAEAWFDRMMAMQAAGGTLQLVTVDKASGLAVGTCLLFRHEPASARAELGYALKRDCWGRGLMCEALAALIGAAFGPLSLRRLEAEVDVRNRASAQLLRRLGFVQEGLLRQRWVSKGETRDMLFLGLLRGDWHPADPT